MFGDFPRNGVQRLGFLLLPKFSLMAFSSASEPLRTANVLAGKRLYDWQLISMDGKPVTASNGMQCVPDAALGEVDFLPMVIVCSSFDPEESESPTLFNWLRKLGRQGADIGAIDTGSHLLGAAGLLDGYQATIHWEHLDSFSEMFPRVDVMQDIYVVDRDRFTSAGSTVGMDMMLNMIRQQHGYELAAAVAEAHVYSNIREAGQHQRMALADRLSTVNAHVLHAVELMRENLEDPLQTGEIADQLGISQRELERLFKKWLHATPGAYYRKLRLERARALLKQTSMSVLEVAVSCGFTSSAHFSRAYSSCFGHAPSIDRRIR